MRRIYFILASLMLAMAAMAEGIDQHTALLKARKFMPGKEFTTGKVPAKARAKTPRGSDAFYVFNAKDNGGFVVVSGDDRTDDILCYSEHGHLDVDQIPENMKWWLDELASQIEALGTSLAPAPKMAPAAAIAPLIKSSWGQDAPYNYMCPDGNYVDYDQPGYHAEQRCVTGCVATAMAQVMYYWKWPLTCPALDAYEVVKGKTLKALPATTFKWGKMKNTYGWSETGESADAVAELMRYCGQAVHMRYTPSSSSASLSPSIMASVFQYSPNCHRINRDKYSVSRWESIIYDELASQRPVLYEGGNNSGGHHFIVDGYDGAGLFHFNWGWNGSYDCYSVLSLADPYHQGDEQAFWLLQSAIIGVKPAEDGEVMMPLMRTSIFETVPAGIYSRSSSAANFSDVSLEGTVGAEYTLPPTSPLNVEVGWGLFQDDKLLQLLDNKTLSIPAYLQWSTSYNASVSFGAGLADGLYELAHVYRFAGETEWKACHYYYSSTNLWGEVKGNKLTVRVPNPDNMSFEVNSVTTSDEPFTGEAVSVNVNITNTGNSLKEIIGLWIQKPGSQQWVNTISSVLNVYPGKSADVNMSFVPDQAGIYQLKITAGGTEEALATATVKVAASELIVIDGITYQCIPDYRKAIAVRNEESSHDISGDVTILQKVSASGVDCQVVGIGDRAFFDWYYMTSLTIPEGVTSIGNIVFRDCFNLYKVVLPSTVTSFGDYVFSNCQQLSAVCSYIKNPPAISDYTFVTMVWNNETQQYDEVPLPATLYVPIGTKAKYEAIRGWTMFAGIEEGELLETVVDGLRYSYNTGGDEATVIQDESYKELTEVSIPATVSISGKRYRVTAIGNQAFSRCGQLRKLALAEGLETIGDYAFEQVSVEELTFPSTLRTIGDEAFYGCNSIKKLVIPEGVAIIGSYAFAYMYFLTRLELPGSLREIGEYVIQGCDNLAVVVSHIIDPPAVSEKTFDLRLWNGDTQRYDQVPCHATLYVPIGTKAKYEAIRGWTMFAGIEEGELLETVVDGLRYSYNTGGDEATVIQDESYKELAEVSIPATVSIGGKNYRVTIGSFAFSRCRQLRKLALAEGLETIGDYAFELVPVEEVNFPSTLRTIGKAAFNYCNGIKKLVIPEGVNTIGLSAFADMYGLTRLELPSTLKEIGGCVIQGCENLAAVVSHIIDPPAVADNTFATGKWNQQTYHTDLSPSSATLYVPIGTKAKYEALSGWTWFAGIEEDEQAGTGIARTELTTDADGQWYNVQGMPVDKPQKGVFIRNGHKVVVR